jgi:hypothetical protein
MNIYEQLNKINDTESLSEKYNVKNAKELKKLKESISSIKIPAPWNKYLEVYDYTPENDGEYTVGDRIGEYTVVAHLVPKAAYEDQIDSYPMLFRDKEGLLVGATSHDRVYPLTLDMFGLTESLCLNRKTKNIRKYSTFKESVNTTQDYSEIREYLSQGKIVDVTDYEGEYSDIIYALCADVEEQLMDKYEDLFIEPSVQAGHGGIFAWFTRDAKQYEAEWDYEEDCKAINDFVRSNANEEGFKKAYSAYVEDKLSHAVLNEKMSKKYTKRLQESSKSTKDLTEAAKQIIADLESRGFVNSDIVTVAIMIKETIDSRYPGYVSPMNRLRKAFPDLNI